jgi:hypothetical protein
MIAFRPTPPRTAPFLVPAEVLANHTEVFPRFVGLNLHWWLLFHALLSLSGPLPGYLLFWYKLVPCTARPMGFRAGMMSGRGMKNVKPVRHRFRNLVPSEFR